MITLEIEPLVALAGLIVGFVVGLTGMGGGALMTPILVLLFGVQPLAAVSSDLVAAVIMKPVGGAVHLRQGTVDKRLVTWLVIGSVPCAFAGVLVIKALGDGQAVEDGVKLALGVALLLAAASILAKSLLVVAKAARGTARSPRGRDIVVRPVPTMLIGALGGFVVGMTSVGSGSLIIVLLLLLYPGLTPKSLVGTDLVQAVPLVGAAAIGHLLFGDFQLGLTTSLLVGSLPGVYIGARLSSRASGTLIRRCLVFVLAASGMKLLGVPTLALGVVLVVLLVLAVPLWMAARVAVGGTPWGGWPRASSFPGAHDPDVDPDDAAAVTAESVARG